MDVMRVQETSSSTFRCSYRVFLSFYGKDTRNTFTDHLYTALDQAGFHPFKDDDELPRGENIECELQKAIRESRISIIVLSENYACSRWFLDELVKILERKKMANHNILPVFYHVDPSHVRNQTKSFATAFAEHEQRFKAEVAEIKEKWLGRVKEWRRALKEVADLAGMSLKDGSESEFIHKIAKEVGHRLKSMELNVGPHLVGIESRVESINLWLQDRSTAVGMASIYGIGGIGKTTIAKKVYNQNFDHFEGSSFLANVRETLEQPNGVICLQRQFIHDILKGKKEKIKNVDAGLIRIRETICCKIILLVLDDVDTEDQLNAILGMQNWFFSGSKIIITTRHERLLKTHEACQMFKVAVLNEYESLQLFSWHAFWQDHPTEHFMEHAKKIVQHCGGIPLALQVLGSSLFGESEEVWKDSLKKFEIVFDDKIFTMLKISYDSLDRHDRNLFLDIACFFVGKDKDFTVKVLEEYDCCPKVGIRNLQNRCLITINHDGKLMMHQLLQGMGREIIYWEYPNEPGKHSRVWHQNDALKILREKTGTETVLGLNLQLNELKQDEAVKKVSTSNARNLFDESMVAFEGNSLKRRHLNFFSWLPIHSTSQDSFPTSNALELETSGFSKMSKNYFC